MYLYMHIIEFLLTIHASCEMSILQSAVMIQNNAVNMQAAKADCIITVRGDIRMLLHYLAMYVIVYSINFSPLYCSYVPC